MTDSKFSLRWNDFETNMTVALKELREEKDFFDVTIACEDSQIQAHKVILSACSTFFRNLLRRNPHQHPLLYLKGVKYKDLLGILDFMYNLQQAGKNEILEVVPVQPIVKHSPKSLIAPIQKATHTTPKKIRADTTPAPKILEQCILEAEIEQEPKRTIQVVLEKTNSMVTVTSSKGKLPFLSHIS